MASSRYSYSSGGSGSGSGPPYNPTSGSREAGARRKRLAALAGTVYRAGAAAATEIKEQYNNTRIRNVEASEGVSIPGAFPQVSIIHAGEEQMVLFPSYAKRHVKRTGELARGPAAEKKGGVAAEAEDEEEYWRHEWVRLEDERAVVDVDVRGWIYMPSKGPMTRRNRMLIGLARRLSGIPTPTTTQGKGAGEDVLGNSIDEAEERREERKIAREAREIERKGRDEKEVASRGGYSEAPRDDVDSEEEAGVPRRAAGRSRSGTATPMSPPGSPVLGPKGGGGAFAAPSEMSEAELAVANANLMARIGPFMTTPLVELPITLFFYNDEQSQSRTVMTNDSGHFVTRVALDFVPTHVRVLANDKMSAVEPIEIIESRGVSLISDIDDTIKRSNIALGAREIFRNTFIRDLGDLTIDGVKEWYYSLFKMGVQVHYCSNSPWQLFPVLATYFLTAGLPPGSIHLKHYSGMLQGIFEPVAERKKGTLERILRDFPERQFLLVGDSGEADLEVYTELALANPGRILAVFIRDVTTPEKLGYFDPSMSRDLGQRGRRENTSPSQDDDPSQRPSLPPRVQSEPAEFAKGPPTGTLIDFSDDADTIRPSNPPGAKANASSADLLSRKAAPPPRPAKPAALRSAPSDVGRELRANLYASGENINSLRPLAQQNNYNKRASESSSSGTKDPASPSSSSTGKATPPPPPPRRSGTSGGKADSAAAVLAAAEFEALPERIRPASIAMDAAQEPYNKKIDLWMQRLERAHEVLEKAGVQLYTWRRGSDVIKEAEGIVRDALGGRRGRGVGGRGGEEVDRGVYRGVV
ncbi:hypothetical protein B0T18DRAFT_333874 [Schizothecium vesticola]|uniref:Phosphatidate phosphatase APP1 catalytic domain-containing protein n=1 Tax=Schizothecium vesticola TaxID=314040 RepID=A0AA40BQZ3_9PEZI|nr:hypothetical protein B0T18DRAFT_333874 [Schizothecium vesticola]